MNVKYYKMKYSLYPNITRKLDSTQEDSIQELIHKRIIYHLFNISALPPQKNLNMLLHVAACNVF